MTSNTDSNPEDEYADDEYADYDAEDRDQPSAPTEIPGGEPEADVLEQRQEVHTATTTGNGRYSTGPPIQISRRRGLSRAAIPAAISVARRTLRRLTRRRPSSPR